MPHIITQCDSCEKEATVAYCDKCLEEIKDDEYEQGKETGKAEAEEEASKQDAE